jgi:hypothetical protein
MIPFRKLSVQHLPLIRVHFFGGLVLLFHRRLL